MSKREFRTHRVSFRISDSDFQVFCQLSERGGFHSLSGFLRYLAYCAVRAAGGDMTGEIPESVLRVFKRTYDYDVRTLAEAVKLVEAGRVGNGVIEITGKTGKEYTRSGYSQYIEKNDGQVYDDKLRAAGNLDEAVRASTDYVNEEIKHPRKDNIREFARGRVLMRVGQNDYNAEVVVGYTKNGEMLLYDIVNFKPDTFSVKERTSRQPGRGEAGMIGDYGKSSKVEGPIKSGPATTDNSISQNNAAVNSQYTQESENVYDYNRYVTVSKKE